VTAAPGAQPSFAVVGEALIDLVGAGDDEPWLARPGGSPYNVAIGLARLGRASSFVGRLSGDPLGAILREHAARSGVNLRRAVRAGEPTTIALVEFTGTAAEYRFGVRGTADFQWTEKELAVVGHDDAAVHFGSLASWTPPGGELIAGRIGEIRNHVLVSYDPNVRPRLQTDRRAARRHVEDAVGLADVVKTSTDDLAWLYPNLPPSQAARNWLDRGPQLVVVTAGGDGSTAHLPAGTVSCPAHAVDVIDTIGAGDAFMAGLLDALADRDLLHRDALSALSRDNARDLLKAAALVAALTCARAGANPPRRAEVDAARAQSG
jgi:fructokinase